MNNQIIGKNRRGKGDEKILVQVDKDSNIKKIKSRRTNLLSFATEEKLEQVNKLSKKQRGISNLTYEKLYGGE